MKREEIMKLIVANEGFKDFVNSEKGHIDLIISNVPISIYKEDIGVNYYYRVPYNESYNYNAIEDFMKKAIPILNRLVENARNNNLYGPDCVQIISK